jgi:hypothetical protein
VHPEDEKYGLGRERKKVAILCIIVAIVKCVEIKIEGSVLT